MLGQLSKMDSRIKQDFADTPCGRQIADRLEGLVMNTRHEPRTCPKNKLVRVTAVLDVQVRDESRCP